MADSRKERDKVLADYRTKANEKKEFAEKIERRVSELNVDFRVIWGCVLFCAAETCLYTTLRWT